MAPDSPGPKPTVTFEEWLHFPEDEAHPCELIDGEVSEMPGPTLWHQELCRRLVIAFSTFLDNLGGGFVYFDANVRLATGFGPRPDLVFVRERPTDPLYIEHPDLLVEVVSDPWRDLRMKRDRYEQFGVPEYWAVIPEAERVEVYRLVDGRLGKPLILEPGETVSPLTLPGLVIDLAELFRN